MEFSQQTGTSIHRNEQETVNLMVLEIMALVAILEGLIYGVVANTLTAANLTHMVTHVATKTRLNFKDIQESLNSLAKLVSDHLLALDFLLAKQSQVCALANTSCCAYINT
jgi:hypothetical protein